MRSKHNSIQKAWSLKEGQLICVWTRHAEGYEWSSDYELTRSVVGEPFQYVGVHVPAMRSEFFSGTTSTPQTWSDSKLLLEGPLMVMKRRPGDGRQLPLIPIELKPLEYFGFHHEFALATTPADFLSFAKRYGRLGYSLLAFNSENQIDDGAEPLALWEHETAKFRCLLKLHEIATSGDEDIANQGKRLLGNGFYSRIDGSTFEVSRGLKEPLQSIVPTVHIPGFSADGRSFIPNPDPDPREFARWFLFDYLNRELDRGSALRLLPGDSDASIVVKNLLGALYVSLIKEILFDIAPRRCLYCGGAMPSSLRSDAKYCSRSCRNCSYSKKLHGVPR